MRASSVVRQEDTTGQWKGWVFVELEEHLDFIIQRACSSQDEAETWANTVKGIFDDDIEAYTLGIIEPLHKRIWNALKRKEGSCERSRSLQCILERYHDRGATLREL